MLLRPNLWSYNYYPFRSPLINNEPDTDLSKCTVGYWDFYHFLDLYRQHIEGTYEKFWAFAMVLAHGSVEKGVLKNYQPAPTEEMLRFEVMNALAYGAQGIMYYNFGMRRRRNEDAQGFLVGSDFTDGTAAFEAPLECNPIAATRYNLSFKASGDLYNAVKKINNEIKSWNNVFYGCKVEKIYHRGQYPTTSNGTTIYNDFPGEAYPGSLKYVYGVSIPKNGLGVVISSLTNGTNNYIVFVNHDPFNPQKITVTHSTKASFMMQFVPGELPNATTEDITKDDSEDRNTQDKAGIIIPEVDKAVSESVNLVAGGIAVLHWSEK